MDTNPAGEGDELFATGFPNSPGVRVSRGDDDPGAVLVWYGTFDEILRALHDLWWHDRRIPRIRLIADWLVDRGLFDPEDGRSFLSDPSETASALRLVRDRFDRRADAKPEAEAALDAILRLLDEAITQDRPVWLDRI